MTKFDKGKETVKLNKSAMQFVDENCFASVKTEEGKTPKFEMVAYSGGIIKGHWYWGDLAIDLQGMNFPKKKIPILEDHMTSLKLGFATKFGVDGKLTVEESTLIDTPECVRFRENSSAGFPYEASIYARPTVIEEVSEGESVEVNGYTFKGPGTVWRKSTLKEVSVCTFGYDPNTKSSASMSEESEEVVVEKFTFTPEVPKITEQEEKPNMNREQFKKEHPAEYEALVAEISGGIETKFNATVKELEGKLAAAEELNTKLSAENKETEKRLVVLERVEAGRKEREIKLSADEIFANKFKDSELPERLESKIRRLVNHEKFMKEGDFDSDAFSAAVDAELKDWAPEEGEEASVHGFSTSAKSFSTNTDKATVIDATVDRMLAHVGQGSK